MKKPTVYLDTNIISTLHYDGTDFAAMARRMATRDWWDSERRSFSLFGSMVTEQELAAGVYGNQKDCVRFARRLRYLPVLAAVRRVAATLIDETVIPKGKPGDAAQLAIAVVHKMDYLLTWNYAHLANPATQGRGSKVVARLGYRMPWLVSPDSIPRASLGQSIRRSDDD